MFELWTDQTIVIFAEVLAVAAALLVFVVILEAAIDRAMRALHQRDDEERERVVKTARARLLEHDRDAVIVDSEAGAGTAGEKPA